MWNKNVEVKKNKDLNQKNYSEIVDNVQSEYIKNNDTHCPG